MHRFINIEVEGIEGEVWVNPAQIATALFGSKGIPTGTDEDGGTVYEAEKPAVYLHVVGGAWFIKGGRQDWLVVTHPESIEKLRGVIQGTPPAALEFA